MQWNNDLNCGFSTAKGEMLYLPVEQGETVPNVAEQEKREDSLLHTVREILAIRRNDIDFEDHANLQIVYADRDRRSFAYQRGNTLMLCNPSGQEETIELPGFSEDAWTQLYGIGTGRCEQSAYTMGAQSFLIFRGK